MAIEDVIIEYPCPECHEKFRVSIYQLLKGGVILCPACQATNVETEMVAIACGLEELGRSLENLKKCLNRSRHLRYT